MVELQNYRKINNCESVQDYIDLYENIGIEKFVEIMKYAGKAINPYDGKWPFQKKFEKIDNYVREHENQKISLWNTMIDEAKNINSLYENIYKINDYKKAESVPSEFSTPSFIIMFEMYLEYLINEINGESDKNQKLGLNFSVDYAFGQEMTKVQKYISIYEHSIAIADEVLKYLIFYKNKGLSYEYMVNDDYLQASFGHLKIADQKSVIEKLDKEWRFLDRTIRKENQEIQSECTSIKARDFFIINSRIKDRKKIMQNDIVIAQDALNTIEAEEGINSDEKAAKLYLKDFFSVKNLNYSCIVNKKDNIQYQIRLDVLIRAYALLKIESEKFINERQCFTYDIQDVCLILSKDDVKDLFLRNAIEAQYVDNLIQILTLESYKDLYDTPLIPFNDNYLIIPGALKMTDIAQVVLSCVNQFNFRGKAFEACTIECLKEAGIEAISKSRTDETGEYQCDVLFGIGNTLFICECKAWGEPKSIHAYYEYIEKCIKAKKQLDRIANHYLVEKKQIQNELEMEREIVHIQKIILLANAVGMDNVIDDTVIIDYSMLNRFLKREKPTVQFYAEKKMYKYCLPNFCEYEGKITANKLIRFLHHPSAVQLAKKNMEWDIRDMNINDAKIHYDTIQNKVDSFIQPGQSYNEYLQQIEKVYSLS